MKTYPLIRDLYGQLRGYRRWSIRRDVARNASMLVEKLQAQTDILCGKRYLAALRDFPTYVDLIKERTGISDLATIPFEQLPVLTKPDLTAILSTPNRPPSTLIPHSTGGSTGQPFSFLITRESYEWRTAVSDRGYSWAQAEEGQRSFYVWGTAIHKPGWKQRLKQGIHHWLQNRRYFDSFHFDDAAKAECCRQINRFKPVSLVGYAGNLIALARFVSRNPGALTWRAKTAVTAAEGLRPGMRELIEAHLANEVFMSYGSREFMLIGMEGPAHDGYHIAADNLYVEVVDDNGKPLPPGQLGRIVITDLHNDATPFVRYAIGDLGRMGSGGWGVGSGELGVGCGSLLDDTVHSPPPTVHRPQSTLHRLPKLASVEGRLQEVIELANGEKLTALFIPHLMKEFDWVDGYQVMHDAPGKITVNLVTDESEWKRKADEIRKILAATLGDDMDIGFDRVAMLATNASGKTPIVLNHDNFSLSVQSRVSRGSK